MKSVLMPKLQSLLVPVIAGRPLMNRFVEDPKFLNSCSGIFYCWNVWLGCTSCCFVELKKLLAPHVSWADIHSITNLRLKSNISWFEFRNTFWDYCWQLDKWLSWSNENINIQSNCNGNYCNNNSRCYLTLSLHLTCIAQYF